MFNVNHIIQSGGLLLLGLFLFAEVGLFLGFFLPGDTLLIAAGIYAMMGKMSLLAVIIVATIAAIAGDSTAYYLGRRFGRSFFKKEDSLLFDPKHIARAEHYYQKYGSKTVLMAHFVPVIRTFNPLVSGIARMPYRKFLMFDAIGDLAWAITVSLVGYYIGSKIPNVDHYILYVVGLVIIVSIAPTIVHLVLRKRKLDRNKNL
jgi:membrane-associated protein